MSARDDAIAAARHELRHGLPPTRDKMIERIVDATLGAAAANLGTTVDVFDEMVETVEAPRARKKWQARADAFTEAAEQILAGVPRGY